MTTNRKHGRPVMRDINASGIKMKETTRNFNCGHLTDVYEYLKKCTGYSTEMDLLKWFLNHYSKLNEKPTVIWADEAYYAGNHAHEEWEVSIAVVETVWGRCIKIIDSYYDNAFYSYDSHGETHEEIFLFVD